MNGARFWPGYEDEDGEVMKSRLEKMLRRLVLRELGGDSIASGSTVTELVDPHTTADEPIESPVGKQSVRGGDAIPSTPDVPVDSRSESNQTVVQSSLAGNADHPVVQNTRELQEQILEDYEKAYLVGLKRLDEMNLDADLRLEAAGDLARKFVRRYGEEALRTLELKLRAGHVGN